MAILDSIYAVPVAAILVFAAVNILSHHSSRRPAQPEIYGKTILIAPYMRRVVYALAIMWAYLLFYHVSYSISSQPAALSSLAGYFGLTGLSLLFFALIPGLMKEYFPNSSSNALLANARRAIGVSAFSFILLHVVIGFFNNLSGSLRSIFFLSAINQAALVFSIPAFMILSLMALTSFDAAAKRLGQRAWDLLHWMIYLAIPLALAHAFLIGSYFVNTRSFIAETVDLAALTFVLLEARAKASMLWRSRNARPAWRTKSYNALLLVAVAAAFFLSNYALTRPQYGLQENGLKTYQTNGIVLAVNVNEQYITINQDEIPGIMSAMSMSYQVGENNSDQIKQLKEGDNASITLAYNQGYLDLYNITKR